MGIDFGSLAPVIGGPAGNKDLNLFKALSGLLGNIDNFVKAAGYFTGTGFQDALANGFMK